jgi:prefoldin subunit 5
MTTDPLVVLWAQKRLEQLELSLLRREVEEIRKLQDDVRALRDKLNKEGRRTEGPTGFVMVNG